MRLAENASRNVKKAIRGTKKTKTKLIGILYFKRTHIELYSSHAAYIYLSLLGCWMFFKSGSMFQYDEVL